MLCLSSACATVFSSPEKVDDATISITLAPPPKTSPLSEPAQRGPFQKCVSVFYATSRQLGDGHSLSYSKDRSAAVDYGVCQVRLPNNKELGTSSDSQRGLSKEVSFSKTNIFRRSRLADSSQLIDAIDMVKASSNRDGLIVFVHGYACSFDKAVRIGAQLSQGSGMPVLIFAWPSRNNFLRYSADECNAEWSYPDFAQTLRLLSENFGSQKITLISHSMGARIITWTLRERDKKAPRFKHNFFSCPDIDKETFARFSPSIANASQDTKVFVSGKDIRLGVSEFLHGASRMGRPGRGKNDMPIMAGIETIDFSALDRGIGHCIPYTLIFQALNRDQSPEAIELITKEGEGRTRDNLKVAKNARKHEHKVIVQ